MRSFQPLEIVGRGSETQLQVGKKCFFLILALKGFINQHQGPYSRTSYDIS